MGLRLGLMLAGVLVLLAGGWRWLQWRRRAQDYGQWPSVDAAILASSLRARTTLDDDNIEIEYWEPQVHYRYAVAGTEFEGRKAQWFDVPFRARADAENWLSTHGAGASAQAFYDPARPSESALALNAPDGAPGTGLIWIGGALIVGALLAGGTA